MSILFSKYHGAGNDFILIKDTGATFPENDHELIRELCDRHFGVGADGLMLLRSSEKHDFTMMYFNSNGHEGTMCGNGGRCLIAFAKDCGHINKNEDIIFDAIDGEHEGVIVQPGLISLNMRDVRSITKMDNGFGLNTGSVHHVEYVDNLVDIDVYRAGRALREHKMYKPNGCNVNYIQEEKDGSLSIRTYERGVDNETLACGTGAIASAIVHHFTGHIKDKYLIRARGGDLEVSFQYDGKRYYNIWLEGPTAFVFEGVWKK